MPLRAGSRLGPYEIQSPMGAGGMGEVYRARDTRLDRSVAVKVLSSELTADGEFRAGVDPELAVRACAAAERLTGLRATVADGALHIRFDDETKLAELVETLEAAG